MYLSSGLSCRLWSGKQGAVSSPSPSSLSLSPPTQTLLPQLPPRGNPFPHNLTAAQLLSLPHVSILHSSQPAPPDAPSDLNPFRWGLPEWAAGLAPACLNHQPHFTQAGGGEGKAERGRQGSEAEQGTSSLDPRDSGRALTSWRVCKTQGKPAWYGSNV